MRIIHTSDWHLGQHFMGKTREAEHRDFLNWLLELIRKSRADALVVAGDIFDTGTPPSYARTLYNEFIVSLQNTPCTRAVFLAGNHDSAATLNEGKSLLAYLKTDVIAGLSDHIEDHVMVLKDYAGAPGLILCALPFLRPRDLVNSAAGQSGQEKQEALSRAIRLVYQAAFEVARGLRDDPEFGHDLPIMATGHLTAAGTTLSESVRDIYIGSLSAFPVDAFPPADYVALGHIHKPQILAGQDHVRYSGSPVPLGFDEGNLEKSVVQVDFNPGKPPEIRPVQVPCFRRLISLKGDLDAIGKAISGLAGIPDAPEDAPRTAWLEVEVAEDDYLSDLSERIREMIQERGLSGVELLRVRRRRRAGGERLAPDRVCRLEELSPEDVFRRRLDLETMDGERAEKMTELFRQVVEKVMSPEAQGEVTP